MQAKGTFDVQVVPQGSGDLGDGVALGRMTLAKQFKGDFVGVGKGEMLTSSTSATGSAAYVAVDRLTGMLNGRSGAFVLLHRGLANKDGQTLTIDIAPYSGTGELAGIAGTFTIEKVEKQHFYVIDYTIGD